MKEKDFAGFVPLDKAALKGHHEAVRTLLRFGADPSSGIKGTKAIHDGKFFLEWRIFERNKFDNEGENVYCKVGENAL